MDFGDIADKAKDFTGGMDVGKVKDSVSGLDDNFKGMMNEAEKEDFSGKNEHSGIMKHLDGALGNLGYLEGLKNVNIGPVDDAARAASGIRGKLMGVKDKINSGNYQDKNGFKKEVGGIYDNAKDKVLPLGKIADTL